MSSFSAASANFILFVIGNFLTAFFFIFYSQALKQNADNVNHKQFVEGISGFFVLLAIAYIGFTIGILATIMSFRFDSFMLGGMLEMGYMSSGFPWNPPDPTYILIYFLLEYWHIFSGNTIFTYFLLWFIPLLGLAIVNLINGFNFFVEEGVAGKQVKKTREISPALESELVGLISDI